jgi:phosphoribosylglycinamide formyltransferase-1
MTARVAILASGGGTTAEAFIRNSVTEQLDLSTVLVIASKPQAGVIDRIEQLNAELGLTIPCVIISSKTHPISDGEIVEQGCQTMAEEQAILDALVAANIDLVALLGYMKKVGSKMVETYGWLNSYTSNYQARMTNSHPGPLPATAALYGEGVQQRILDLGLVYGTQTLHLVASDYDDGPVLATHDVPVEPNDTAAILFARIQHIEKQHIASDINSFWQQHERHQAALKLEVKL